MTLIPDPTDPRKPAIVADDKGTRLAPAVQFAPIGTPLGDHDAWITVGYVDSDELP